jgi:hypothetical protein
MHSIRLQFLGRLLALLAVALPLRSQALEYFSPPRDARELPARPTLAWSFGTGNLLTNPGFEDGTNGWTVSGATVVNLVFPNRASEGSKAIWILRGMVSRQITLPAGPEELTLSFALQGVARFSESPQSHYAQVEVVDLEGGCAIPGLPRNEHLRAVERSVVSGDVGSRTVSGTPGAPDLNPARG